MALCCRRFKKPVTAHHRTNQAGPLLSSIWPTPLTGHSPPWRARGCRAERPPSGQRGSPGVSALLACPQTARQADSLTVARVHNMRPFLLTPGARAAPSPSTLSRLLLPLHLQINGRRNHLRRHVHASSIAPSPISPRLRNRRGRFFASSSSQMAAPADAPGGSADAFEVIRAHQAKTARLSPVEEIRTILDRSVRGVLATHSQEHAGYPSGSMVDFACDQDGSPILAVSSLAVHSKNLSGNPKCSLVVAKDPEDRTDTVITVYGDAVPVSDEQKDLVRSAYLRRHPDAFWVDFGDFSFLHIKPKAVRYVSGVATALLGSGEFSPAEYKEAKVDPISQFSTPITSHMNKDHTDDTKLIVQYSTTVKVDFAYMLDVDSLGFNVKAGYDGSVLKLRIPFPRQAQDRKDVKTLIVEMLQAAKAASSHSD
ncbi:hypothetical protein PAHAL_2G421300 [Panicum hallii]|uniref:Uncharacterized protein n=2 Tax=Panicum hallii TaxID=206008 RepID=A0A2T8KSD4_9POAL|nr:hypothetical protein PAHAL_2G421300 [Panicum hallii]